MPYLGQGQGTPYDVLPNMLNDPEVLAGAGKVFTKNIGGATQLFFQSDSGAIYQLTPAAASPVSSVFGRTGAIVAVAGDYNTDQITNNSTWTGTFLTDVLNGAKVGADNNTNNIAINSANIASNTSAISALQTSKANATFATRTVTAATDTLLVTDNNTVIRGNRATVITQTVPSGTMAAGSVVGYFQEAAGKITLVAGGGMTIVSEGGLLSTAAINSYASLLFLTSSLAVFAGSRS